MVCNTAVFYDVENLISLFNAKGTKTTLQLDEIHRRILNLDVVQGISVQRAYADWAQQVNRNLRSYVLQIGIEPVQIFNTNQNDKVKNAADVSLIIDAVELLVKRPEIENYVIASGDGIFAFLAKKLHEYGKRVIGCGFDRHANIIFKNACDIFLPLEKADQSLNATIKNLNKGTIVIHADTEQTPVSAPVAPPAAPEVKVPSKLPKNKFSEVLIRSGIPVWKNPRDLPGSLHVIKRMINALFNGADEDTELEISLFKTYLDHYLPKFRMGFYGFKRFGEFMRFVVTGSPYCLVVSEGTVLRIARRDVQHNENESVMEDSANLRFFLSDGIVINSLFDIEDGLHFTYSLQAPAVEEPKPAEPKQSVLLPKAVAKKETALKVDKKVKEVKKEITEKVKDEVKKESVRKIIKEAFTRLSKEDKIETKEIKKLLTPKYSLKTFSVTVPVFKLIKPGLDINIQRMHGGKIKYWKDEFEFKGKSYLIFKEWVEKAHGAKFEAWLAKQEN